MHQLLLQLFIEVTFNLTLVDETAWDDTTCTSAESRKINIMELILSASLPARRSTFFSRLSFQPFDTSQMQTVGGAEDAKVHPCGTSDKTLTPSPSLTLFKHTSSIVRGRELPFPIAPLSRSRILQKIPLNINVDSLFKQHYSSISSPALADSDDIPSRGRTSRHAWPLLLLGDSRIATSQSSKELHLIQHVSKNNTLRVPPFPLSHRPRRRSVSESPARKDGSIRRASKRVSSVPPPSVLRSPFSSVDFQDRDDLSQ